MSRLDMFLGQMYAADVLHKTPTDLVVRLAHDAVAADQDMKAEALERIKQLEPVVRSRGSSAHVEKKMLEYLRTFTDG